MKKSQVIDLVMETLGIQPVAVIHQRFGHNSVTYEAVLPDRSVIVRMNEDAAVFAATERNLQVLAGLGLPVSTVIASDLSKLRFPFAYMFLDKIPGRDLRYNLAGMTQAQMTRLAEQIVEFQSCVMTLPLGTGYGYVGIGEPGPYASWQDFVCSKDKSGQASHFELYFRQVPQTCFLDDITVKNVIMENGELQGLIDFDGVCYGDPLYWLALTAVGVVSDVGPVGAFYVDKLKCLWGLTSEQEQVLAYYCILMARDFVQRTGDRAAPKWKSRMQDATAQWCMQCGYQS